MFHSAPIQEIRSSWEEVQCQNLEVVSVHSGSLWIRFSVASVPACRLAPAVRLPTNFNCSFNLYLLSVSFFLLMFLH